MSLRPGPAPALGIAAAKFQCSPGPEPAGRGQLDATQDAGVVRSSCCRGGLTVCSGRLRMESPNERRLGGAKERGGRLALHSILWIALHLGRSAARALLYPIVLYFLVKAKPQRRASRRFDAGPRRPAGLAQVARHLIASGHHPGPRLLVGRAQGDWTCTCMGATW